MKTPKGTKVMRMVKRDLTAEERTEYDHKARSIGMDIEKIKEERLVLNRNIRTLEKDRRQLNVAAAIGYEEKEMECTEVMNYDKLTVDYYAKGQIVETRKMTDEERQTDIEDEIEKTPKKTAKVKIKKSQQPTKVADNVAQL